MYSPLDLTKVRLQASGDKGMVQSLQKTVRTAGAFELLSLNHFMPRLLQILVIET